MSVEVTKPRNPFPPCIAIQVVANHLPFIALFIAQKYTISRSHRYQGSMQVWVYNDDDQRYAGHSVFKSTDLALFHDLRVKAAIKISPQTR